VWWGGSVGVVAGNPFLRFRVEFVTPYNDTFPNNLIVFGSVFLLWKRLLKSKIWSFWICIPALEKTIKSKIWYFLFKLIRSILV
jgi:hypothetical protein